MIKILRNAGLTVGSNIMLKYLIKGTVRSSDSSATQFIYKVGKEESSPPPSSPGGEGGKLPPPPSSPASGTPKRD